MSDPSLEQRSVHKSSDVATAASYDCFISYSHADQELVRSLHRGLQRLATPWNRRSTLRVFRDQSDLTANPHLWQSISSALDGSRFLILLLSPESAQSEWVNREVERWMATKPVDRIIPVIVRWAGRDGRTNLGEYEWRGSGVPPALRAAFPEEPRPVDLRWAQSLRGVTLSNERFRDAVAEVAAPILGRSKSELVGEETVHHNRARRATLAAKIGIPILLALTMGAAVVAARNASRSEERGRIALSRNLAAEATQALRSQYDVALLLAAEAMRSAPTLEARRALTDALRRSPAVIRYLDMGKHLSLTTLNINRDGRFAAAGGYRGALVLWDLESGQRAREWQSPAGGEIDHVVVSPDGHAVIAVAQSGRIARVQNDSANEVVVTAEHGLRIDAIALSPDGKVVGTGGRDGQVKLWDASTLQRLTSIAGAKAHVTAMAFSSTGHHLAFGDNSGKVWLYDVANKRVLRSFTLDREMLESMTELGENPVVPLKIVRLVGPDSKLLLGAIYSLGLVVGWDVATGRETVRAEVEAFPMAWDTNAAWLVYAGSTGVVEARPLGGPDTASASASIHSQLVSHAAYSADRRRLVTTDGGSVAVLDFDEPREFARTVVALPDSVVEHMTLSGDGRTVAYADAEGIIHVVDLGAPAEIARMTTGGLISHVRLNRDASLLASESEQEGLVLWKVRSRDQGIVFEERDRMVYDIAFSPDGNLLAMCATTDSSAWVVRILETSGLRARATVALSGSDGACFSVGWQPGTNRVALGQLNGVFLRNLAGADSIRIRMPVAEVIPDFQLSKDGRLLAAAHENLTLWDVPARRMIAEFRQSSDWSHRRTLAFSDAGTIVAVVDESGRFTAVDVTRREVIWQSDVGKTKGRAGLAFAGDTVIIASAGTVVRVDLNPEHWVREACRVANRDLTAREWRVLVGDGVPYRKTCGKPD